MPGMLRFRNALTSVVNSNTNNNNNQANQQLPHDDTPISPGEEDFFVGVDNLSTQQEQEQQQQPQGQTLYHHLSSQVSDEGSAPSILFQSTTESSFDSSVQPPPSLSDLYHNPYDPMSFVKKSIQMSDTDSRAMITAKSNYTASSHTGSSGSGSDDFLPHHPIHGFSSDDNQSPTSIIQVPEMMTRPSTSTSQSNGDTSTTTASESFSSSSMIPSLPPKSPTMVPHPAVQAQKEEQPMLEVDLKREIEASRSPQKTPSKKKYQGSPWRIRKGDSPKKHAQGTPSPQDQSTETAVTAAVTPQPVTPPRQPQQEKETSPQQLQEENSTAEKETEQVPSPPAPPKTQKGGNTHALDSMARLQELEAKKHALRHQRFSLEQKLYEFCASKQQQSRDQEGQEQAPEQLQEDKATPKESEAKDDTEEITTTVATTRRSLSLVKRPWRAPKHQRKKRDSTKKETAKSVSPIIVVTKPEKPEEPKEKTTPTQSLEGRMVVDYSLTTDCLAIDQVDSHGRKTKKHKPLKIVYTGRLNAKGQPHGDNATMQFCDGQVYSGSVRNGLRCGNGHNTWADGQEYKGEWSNNSRNGRGTQSWRDGRTVTGDWKNGHLNGKIYFSWPNGASFDGHAKMGKKDGRGVHKYANGTVFNGHFSNGKENGFGTMTLADGVKYRGQFRNGVKEGYGIMLWKTRTYDGEWLQDKPHGQGRVVWSNGAIYTGHFENGKYHGLGVYVWPSGKKFVGRWSEGVKHGHGLYQWPNGKKYDGEYVNGLKEGYGRMTWADGSTYCGGFKKNKRCGRGVQTDASGAVVHCGLWKDDKPCTVEGSKIVQEQTLELMDADRVMDEKSPWPMQTPNRDEAKSSRIPQYVTSPSHKSARAALVTPDDKHDISSPISSAEGDDESSGGYILTPQQYLYPQRSTEEHIPISITDLE